MPPRSAPKNPPTTSPKPKKGDDPRPVLYPDIRVNGIPIPREALRVSVARAKEILGWEEESGKIKFGADFFLTDLNGNKVRLINNTGNRPWNQGWSLTLAQDVLTGFFEFNGETAIVGKYGTTLSAQHRLIGLILAYQKWSKDDAEGRHWRKVHPEEPFVETLVVTGIEETARVKNSLDNVRPRDFSDVIYSDPTMFGDKKPEHRRVLCRAVSYAVQELWKRTGYVQDPYGLKRTHSGSVEFFQSHPRIKDCVSHLFDENGDNNRVGSIFGSLGYAAAQMYLMAASATDAKKVEEYYKAKKRGEGQLDFSRYDRAEEFWTLLVGGSEQFQTVRDAINALRHPDTNEGGSRSEKLLVIQRAWDEFSEGQPMKFDTIKLDKSDYSVPDGEGQKYLIEFADFGGIDRTDADELKPIDQFVPPEEVAKAAQEIRQKNGHATIREADEDDRQPDAVPTPAPAAKKQPGGKTAIGRDDRMNKFWSENPGTVLVVKVNDSWYTTYGKDAVALAKLLKTRVNEDKDPSGLVKFDFPVKDYAAVCALFKKDKRKVAVEDADGIREVKEVRGPSKG